MNELNNKHPDLRAVSPLKHDSAGRFSRKGGAVEKKEYDPNWLDSLLVFLFISFLMITDLILFAGSGNLKVFNESIIPIPEVLLISAVLVLIIGACVGLIWKWRVLKHILASVFTILFVYMIYNQFSQYISVLYIGSYILPKYMLFGIVWAVLTYIVFQQRRLLYRVLYVLAFGVIFINIYTSYMMQLNKHEFVETHNTQKVKKTSGKRFIYLMLPNLSSYQYLSSIEYDNADITKNIILGFMQKNKMRLLSGAYTPERAYLSNMVANLNPLSVDSVYNHLMNSRVLAEYWRFYNLRNEYAYLKDNELYDIFKDNKFQISAYKSRDFDMCHKQNKFNVNRCIEKVNHPISLYDINLSLPARTGILAIEWLSSIVSFDKFAEWMYKMLKPIADVETMPLIATNYKNLYVVNSAKTFDILFENIQHDSGKQAYFVFIDLPSDMYVYDEYCQFVPQDKWMSLSNHQWITKDYSEQKRDAYLQQTRCLFGKMEQFVRRLQVNDLWSDTVLILQGTSGVNDFRNTPIEKTVPDFLANRSVLMAIHDDEISKFQTDNRLCSTSQFLAEYLFPNKICNSNRLGLHGMIIEEIRERLDKLSEDITADRTSEFSEWYGKWAEKNGDKLVGSDDLLLIESDNGDEFGLDAFEEDGVKVLPTELKESIFAE